MSISCCVATLRSFTGRLSKRTRKNNDVKVVAIGGDCVVVTSGSAKRCVVVVFAGTVVDDARSLLPVTATCTYKGTGFGFTRPELPMERTERVTPPAASKMGT